VKEAKVKRLLAPALVLAALVLAGPAAANTAHANGSVLANGTLGPAARFSIDYNNPTTQVTFSTKRVSFRSTSISSVVVLPYVVKMTGVGISNGRKVPFVAIATHHPSPTGDWFKISWNHGPSYGGRLTTGSVDIDALIEAVSGS
jgi:hypothetical protein